MQASRNRSSYGEDRRNINTFHGPKKQLLGVKADLPAPAWKKDGEGSSKVVHGSRAFLTNLPSDVSEIELEDLFKKTIGPLKECFLVYNSQGKSKGMAVITFQRSGDALVARKKYNGKIIDGRRNLKIELLVDQDRDLSVPTVPRTPSLLNRISPAVVPQVPQVVPAECLAQPMAQPHLSKGPRTTNKPITVSGSAPATLPRRRVKKGPKRVKKRTVTVDDLDKEMEDYRASAPSTMMDDSF